MIIYGCMNGSLKNTMIKDISNDKAISILKEKDISFKSLPGCGNLGLRKRDLKSYVENDKSSIKLQDQLVTFLKMKLVISLCVNCFNNSSSCLYLSSIIFNA